MNAPPINPSTPVRAVARTSCQQGAPPPSPFSMLADLDGSPTASLGSPTRRSITAAAIAAANESPTLRRKRSSANASLTARPSMLSLRDQWSSGAVSATNRSVPAIPATPPVKRTVGTSVESQLDDLVATLQIGLRDARPSSSSEVDDTLTYGHLATTANWTADVHDLILVHIDEVEGSSPRLGHALFQPNLLVTRRGDVVSIVDHADWSLLRGTVEETRVVYQNAAKQQRDDGTFSTFDVSRTKTATSSTFYIQARAKTGDEDDAASPCPLMALTVSGVGSDGTLAPDSTVEASSIDSALFDALPNQLRKLLRQTDKLIRASDAAHAEGDTSADGVVRAHMVVMRRRQQLCNGIVALVRKRGH